MTSDFNPNPSKGTFARPYDSSQGFSSGVLLFILIGVLLFALYTVYRVRKSLKNEQENKI